MRFLFGLLIGFAVGFAGALLFAPDTSPLRKEQSDGDPKRKAIDDFGRNDNDAGGVQGVMKALQKQMSEAVKEAKKAAEEAEKEVHRRFDEMVAKQPIDD